jgi:hypothetical protein
LTLVLDGGAAGSKQQAAIMQNHENVNVCNTGQGKSTHRKYKNLKLGSGQVYDCLSN